MHETAEPQAIVLEGLPLYEITLVSFRYSNGQKALSDVSLRIQPGDRLALVGQNGAGKSTLAKHLNGLYPVQEGRLTYKGEELTGEHRRRTRLEVALLFQDPDDQLFCNTLYEDVAFGPLNQGLSEAAADREARRALKTVGLDHLAYKAPHHLSYGQKKRAALATLLAMQPEVLILDEPTANLDPHQEELLLDLLRDFHGTLVCISHDLSFLYELCDRALVLDHGRVHHDYLLRDLISHQPSMREHGLDFSFRFSCCGEHHHGADSLSSMQPAEARPKDPVEHVQPVSVPGAHPLIAVRDLSFVYPDGTWALDQLDFAMNEGEKVAIVGENGAGKSTLLACLLGIEAGAGEYRFRGQLIDNGSRKLLWRNVGMVFQDPADQLFSPSCREEIAFGPRQLGLPEEEVQRRVSMALHQVRLEGFEDRVPLYVSGGERRRLAIASVLAMQPEVLILDEPTAGLDPRSQETVLEILRSISGALILVSHDMFFISELTRRTVVMHRGRLIRDYLTVDFMSDEGLTSLNHLHYTYRNRCCHELLAGRGKRRVDHSEDYTRQS